VSEAQAISVDIQKSSESITMSQPNFCGIPLALRSIPQWLPWKNVVSITYPRGKKIPLNCKNYGAGDSTDPSTWGTYDDARIMQEAYRHTGLGFALTKEVGIFCVDVDECIVKNEINDFGKSVLNVFGNKTYVEASYHKDGIHIFGRGNLPETEKGGERSGIEIYDTGRFIAITGYKLKTSCTEITECQSELDTLRGVFPKKAVAAPKVRKPFSGGTICDKLGLSCSHIAFPLNAKKTANGYQGANPFHGSATGSNFCINEHSNTWFCFRHNSGGGALELYAVSNGIIDCEDAGRGCLDGHWPELFEALEKDGYKLDKNDFPVSIMQKRANTRNTLKALGVL